MSCPDCTTGAKLAGTPKGVIKDDGSYFAAAPEGSDQKRAVVLLTDAFGLGLDNPKIMADYFSEQLQCDVWVPDIFKGEFPDWLPSERPINFLIQGNLWLEKTN